MVTQRRWRHAQEYERSYWEGLASRIALGSAGQLDWYAWKAGEMEKLLADHLNPETKKTAKILEIGSGPIGIVSFLKWGERYTIDPLENFYKTNPVLSQMRDSAVRYEQGTGEKLPFESEFFNLVILDNVLDHVHTASNVLHEIYRVLSKDGKLYLCVNIHRPWGGFLHSILSRLKIDKGHPYTFTAKSIRTFIQGHRFSILTEFINDYEKSREQDRRSTDLKAKIKGYTGLSEFVYVVVCSKKV
jgi:ubiquinone/menaquinone biosynthesis C-methylase UbiE